MGQLKKIVKKKNRKSVKNLPKFIPCDESGAPRIVGCCKNKSQYMCLFPGEPIFLICKDHIKDKFLMGGIERIIDIKSKKDIPLESMGFEKATPTVEETVEKIKQENSTILEPESICVSKIAFGNRMIKKYEQFIAESVSNYGPDCVSCMMWGNAKKFQEQFVSDLCKILISCQSKPKRKKSTQAK